MSDTEKLLIDYDCQHGNQSACDAYVLVDHHDYFLDPNNAEQVANFDRKLSQLGESCEQGVIEACTDLGDNLLMLDNTDNPDAYKQFARGCDGGMGGRVFVCQSAGMNLMRR